MARYVLAIDAVTSPARASLRSVRPDMLALAVLLAIVVFLVIGLSQAFGPAPATQAISLSPGVLPMYAVRTTLRMLAALVASLIFTFTYATAAAKSRRAEVVLIPLLDVLQSVPVLGYLSFTVVFFMSLFPGRALGAELAAVFAIFTSQAWNMAFSFYQSLRTTPHDLDEAARAFRLTAWQRFWRLDAPFAMPGLVWNMMMSMSGGWFFVVASEAISVGDTRITLPGIGSYVARAVEERDLGAIGWAVAAMTCAIVVYDQLLFRPLVAWTDRFRVEQTAATVVPRSWLVELFRRASHVRRAGAWIGSGMQHVARARLALPHHRASRHRSAADMLWYLGVVAVTALLAWRIAQTLAPALSRSDLERALVGGGFTLLRVVVLIALATLVWVPIGVAIGLRPRLAEKVQPLAQFLAAFPANVLFPLAVYAIVKLGLRAELWLSPLMILGTQWYILFNVIAGASAFPTDLREAAATYRVHGWKWWRDVMLPGVFPYYVTGAITASGGAWNASIVSEAVSWGPTKLHATGLGAYIAEMTERGDFARIALGVIVMAVLVIAMNRLLWRPLYAFAERRTRLD